MGYRFTRSGEKIRVGGDLICTPLSILQRIAATAIDVCHARFAPGRGDYRPEGIIGGTGNANKGLHLHCIANAALDGQASSAAAGVWNRMGLARALFVFTLRRGINRSSHA